MSMDKSDNTIIDKLQQMDFNFNKKDALVFILENHPKKNYLYRVISYLLLLNQIKPGKENYIPELGIIYQKYLQYRSQIYKDENELNNPLNIFDKDDQFPISQDLNVRKSLFQDDLNTMHIEPPTNDIQKAVFRVFGVICHFPHKYEYDYSYLPGILIYIYTFYLLGLKFSQKYQLPEDFAEAISFAINRVWLPTIRLTTFLDNPDVFTEHFEDLDERIPKYAPKIYKTLFQNNLVSPSFAFHWHLVLFSDIHNIRDTFLIWDQLIGRKIYFRRILDNFCLAHLIQVEAKFDTIMEKYQALSNEESKDKKRNVDYGPENVILDHILLEKEWDVTKLINDQLKIFGDEGNIFTMRNLLVFILIIMMTVALSLYLYPKFKANFKVPQRTRPQYVRGVKMNEQDL